MKSGQCQGHTSGSLFPIINLVLCIFKMNAERDLTTINHLSGADPGGGGPGGMDPPTPF